jgi:hypothetical protein
MLLLGHNSTECQHLTGAANSANNSNQPQQKQKTTTQQNSVNLLIH